jgi:hypothetical protein
MSISPTSVSKGSKPIILKDENPKILKISELAWSSHENPFSSNSKMPN